MSMYEKDSYLADRVAIGTGRRAVKITLQQGKQKGKFKSDIVTEIERRVENLRKSYSVFEKAKSECTEIEVDGTNFVQDKHAFELLVQIVNTYKKSHPVFLILNRCRIQAKDLIELLRHPVDEDGKFLLEGLTLDAVNLMEDGDIVEYVIEALKSATDLKLLHFKSRGESTDMKVNKHFFKNEKTIDSLKFTTELSNPHLGMYFANSIQQGFISLRSLNIFSFENSVVNAVLFFQALQNGGDLLNLRIQNLNFQNAVIKLIGRLDQSHVEKVDVSFQDSFQDHIGPKLLLGSYCWKSDKFKNLSVNHYGRKTNRLFRFSSPRKNKFGMRNGVRVRPVPYMHVPPVYMHRHGTGGWPYGVWF
eukprot:snap_masked-scaffold_9-processed-gene-2.44-mRNA-1 protein AED:1.00 eAED:1.00 QI:0/-1/0/0/-1/1/1/0/360